MESLREAPYNSGDNRRRSNKPSMLRKQVLFLSHDASASGAPFLLLHLLRWLRANTRLDFKVAINGVGPLEQQFAELAPVVVLRGRRPSGLAGVIERLAPWRAKPMLDALRVRHAFGNERFALIYSNTIVNGGLLRKLPDQECPVISHVHELDYVISQATCPEDLAYALRRTRRFIAASGAVAQTLAGRYAVDRANIDVLHEFVPSAWADRSALEEQAQTIRAELRIPRNAMIAGAAGTVDWRKGTIFSFCSRRRFLARRSKRIYISCGWVLLENGSKRK
jgi:hypothetical protein